MAVLCGEWPHISDAEVLRSLSWLLSCTVAVVVLIQRTRVISAHRFVSAGLMRGVVTKKDGGVCVE